MELRTLGDRTVGMAMKPASVKLLGGSVSAVPTIHYKPLLSHRNFSTIVLCLQMYIPTMRHPTWSLPILDSVYTVPFRFKVLFCQPNNCEITRHGLHQCIQVKRIRIQAFDTLYNFVAMPSYTSLIFLMVLVKNNGRANSYIIYNCRM